MRTTRRCLAAGFLLLGFVALAGPASAQVDARYTGVTPPVINATAGPVGGVLAAGGQRTAVDATTAQVLASQVSSGGVAGTAQAPVQGLAFTGADIVTLVTVGLFAILVGVVLNRRARPRSLA